MGLRDLCARLLLQVVLGQSQQDHRQLLLVDLPVLVEVDTLQDCVLKVMQVLSVIVLEQNCVLVQVLKLSYHLLSDLTVFCRSEILITSSSFMRDITIVANCIEVGLRVKIPPPIYPCAKLEAEFFGQP